MRRPTKLTVVLAGQYERGRNDSVWLLSQYHAPTTGLDEVMLSERSTAARFVIGRLKVSMIGMPTP